MARQLNCLLAHFVRRLLLAGSLKCRSHAIGRICGTGILRPPIAENIQRIFGTAFVQQIVPQIAEPVAIVEAVTLWQSLKPVPAGQAFKYALTAATVPPVSSLRNVR